MTTRFLFHLPLPKLPPLAAAALVICQSCAMPPSAGAQPRPFANRPSHPARKPAAPPRNPREDPRYRPARGLPELRQIAGEIARASGKKIAWQLKAGPNPGPLVRISGGLDDCVISVHPIAARTVPPNTWAFIFGHEFAHRTERLGSHGRTDPATELKADIAGARCAMAAGYRIEAFLGWMLAQPDKSSGSHGSLEARVRGMAARFRVPQTAIQAEARRYAR